MSVLGVLARQRTGTYVVTRPAPRTSTKGRLDPLSVSTFSIGAVVQPVDGRTLESLPEGLRSRELRSVWTDTRLQTMTPGQEPDSVAIGGESWRVERVATWTAQGGTHYHAIVALV